MQTKMLLRSLVFVIALVLSSRGILRAQPTLLLSSGTSAPGQAITLTLSLSGAASNPPAALEWTFTYSTATVSNLIVAAGATLSAAGKTLRCANSSGGYICIGSGLNGNTIADGTVASITATLSGDGVANIGLTGVLGASPTGSAIAIAATGGVISRSQSPQSVAVTPPAGIGLNQVFTATYTDGKGYQDISEAMFMVANDVSGVAGCFAKWQPASNTFYLGDDAAREWMGPIQGGSNATLQNSQCVLNGATSSGSGSGSTLTVRFGLSFASGFAGPKNTYLLVTGSAGSTGWQQAGTWTPGTIPATIPAPSNVSVTPSSGSGLAQVFTATYTDGLCFCGFASGEIDPYVITTAAGNGSRGFSGDGGPADIAQLGFPSDVAFDLAGNLYIADTANNRIRKVTPAGVITTVAGSGDVGPNNPLNGPFNGDGGPATAATIIQPSGVAIDSAGNLFIAEPMANRVRKVSLFGTITTVVSGGLCSRFNISLPNSPSFGGDGGPAAAAQVSCPSGLAADSAGNLYIADTANNRIRKVTPAGIITTVAGSGPSNSSGGFSGDGGPATSAMLWGPSAVAVDVYGNFYIADTQNNRIRKVTPAGIITTIAGAGPSGVSGSFGGDGGPATSADLSFPHGMAIDAAGNLYVADSMSNRIRKITPAGNITTIAGAGPSGSTGGFGGDGGLATAAQLSEPLGVALDSSGNLFVADYGNNRARELSVGPGITAAGIVNAASGVGGAVAPGEFVTIHGANLGPATPVLSNRLTQGLGNTSVFFNGIEALTTYISSGQINAIVPFSVAGKSRAELQVVYQGLAGNRVSVPVASAVPGIFTLNNSGTGQAVALNQDGTLSLASNPAPRGSVISFWATGQGQTNPPGIDGQQPQAPLFPVPALPVFVSIGGVTVPHDDTFFAGLVYPGVMQVNVRVPTTAVPGNLVELLLVVGGATSLQGATLPAVTLAIR